MDGRYIETTRDDWLTALEISAYSLVAVARGAEPLLGAGRRHRHPDLLRRREGGPQVQRHGDRQERPRGERPLPGLRAGQEGRAGQRRLRRPGPHGGGAQHPRLHQDVQQGRRHGARSGATSPTRRSATSASSSSRRSPPASPARPSTSTPATTSWAWSWATRSDARLAGPDPRRRQRHPLLAAVAAAAAPSSSSPSKASAASCRRPSSACRRWSAPRVGLGLHHPRARRRGPAPAPRGAAGAGARRAGGAQHRPGDRLVGALDARGGAAGRRGGASGRPPGGRRRSLPRDARRGAARVVERGGPGDDARRRAALGGDRLRLPRAGRPGWANRPRRAPGRAASSRSPTPSTRPRFVASGDYLWNAGIFVFRGATFLDSLARLAARPGARASRRSPPLRTAAATTSTRGLPADSIDYAVMEKLDGISTLPARLRLERPRLLGGARRGARRRDAAGNAGRGDSPGARRPRQPPRLRPRRARRDRGARGRRPRRRAHRRRRARPARGALAGGAAAGAPSCRAAEREELL